MNQLVNIDNLSVSYGAKSAVKNVSFELPAGRIIGLLGSNGAGKTSLMQAMMGLIPFSGQIKIWALTRAPSAKRCCKTSATSPMWRSCRRGLKCGNCCN